jgi:hypothetical protein
MWRRTLWSLRRPPAGSTDWRKAAFALATHPNRCPAAPEIRKVKRKLRHLLYGKKPHVYRVIYEIEIENGVGAHDPAWSQAEAQGR